MQNSIKTLSNCQRGNRAKKRDCLGGRIIMPRNVGKNSEILRNPLKFAFLTICDPPQEFGAKGESTLTTRLHDTLSVP